MNKVVLFDIDYTLFDTSLYKQKVFQKLSQVLHMNLAEFAHIADRAYTEVRKTQSFDSVLFTKILIKYIGTSVDEDQLSKQWFDEEILKESLYSQVKEVLEKLSSTNNVSLGIFSSGQNDLQHAKLSTLKHFFANEHINIHFDKIGEIKTLKNKYDSEMIYIIEDEPQTLMAIKREYPNAVMIWVKQGRFATRATLPENFKADYTINSLEELPNLFDTI